MKCFYRVAISEMKIENCSGKVYNKKYSELFSPFDAYQMMVSCISPLIGHASMFLSPFFFFLFSKRTASVA